MKTIFIETKFSGKIDYSKIKTEKMPKKIGIATTVQFVDYVPELKKYLEKKGIEVFIGKGIQDHPAQVLGCEQSSAISIQDKVEGYLYFGDGYFHPIGLYIAAKKRVFCFNPISESFTEINEADIKKIENKRRAMLIKFHSSTDIGVIVSIKPGQNHLKAAEKLKEKYPSKNFYFLLFDNIDFNQLENFNFIECWINTACPRIEEDIKVLNLRDLLKE